MKLKGYDVLLLVLAVVTAGAIWLALGSVGPTSAGVGSGRGGTAPQEDETPTSPDDPGDRATTTSGSAPDATSTVEPQSQDQEATTSDQTDSTSEEPIGARERPSGGGQAFAQTLSGRDGDPVDVVVLGDDTSNLRSEWVQLWGQGVAESRVVTVVSGPR